LSLFGSGSFAAVTSLRIERETGETFNFYSSEDGHLELLPLSPEGPGAPEEVSLAFTSHFSPGWPQFFTLRMWFAAPPGEPLAVGLYDDAVVPYQRDNGQPGLQVYGGFTICSGTTGRFEVKQIAFDPEGVLTRFWATFEQTCGQVVRGEVRFNAELPVELHAPSHRTAREGHPLSFDVQGVNALGSPVALSVTGLPPGASFTDSGDGSGHFAWQPAPGQAGFVGWLTFTGETAGGEADVVYTRIDSIPDFDDFDHPIPLPTAPFASSVYGQQASAAADDPECPTGSLPGPPSQDQGSVWYTYTPVESGGVQVAAQLGFPSSMFPPPFFLVGVSIYSGERGALDLVTCGGYAQRFTAVPGLKYHIQVNIPPSSEVRLSGEPLPPRPLNDDLASATVVGALPFSDAIDTRGAFFQTGEPRHCIPPPPGTIGIGSVVPPTNVWYATTPSEDTRVTVDTSASNYPAQITAFSGPTSSLQALGCDPARLSFTALAGETYHLMIGGSTSSFGNQLQVSLTGKPALHIQAAIDGAGGFDRHSGAAFIGGIVHCSRPAEIVVEGTLQQENRRVRGDFRSVVACDGETPWRATVTPLATRNRPRRFAAGVPEDNPDDLAVDNGRFVLLLKPALAH